MDRVGVMARVTMVPHLMHDQDLDQGVSSMHHQRLIIHLAKTNNNNNKLSSARFMRADFLLPFRFMRQQAVVKPALFLLRSLNK
jgi:hypothetical protein